MRPRHYEWFALALFVSIVGVLLVLGAGALSVFVESLVSPSAPACQDGKCDLSEQESLEALGVEELAYADAPVVDLPESMRQRNYNGGSCVHASTINLLRWNGLDELAVWWRKNHGGGEWDTRLASKMEAKGLRYAYVNNGDVAFLEWCIRTRRGAGIGYYPSHAINLVDLNEREAILLDNNRPHEYIRVPRREFEWNWKHKYGPGWAWTLVYTPPPPEPTQYRELGHQRSDQ